MKTNFLKYIAFALSILVVSKAEAQQGPFGWRIGAGLGYTNYYGDLSSYNMKKFKDFKNIYKLGYTNFDQIKDFKTKSYSIFLERKLTPTIGLMLQASQITFTANDFKDYKGEVDTKGTYYSRGLNFKNNMTDLGLSFVFKTDNGKFLGENALIAPYFTLGGGVSQFKVKGDLKDKAGNYYVYGNDSVMIQSSVVNSQDGDFESDLRDLRTEGKSEYSNITPYLNLGLGVKFKLTRRFNLNVETDIRYAFSDYLDDASGKYGTSTSTSLDSYYAQDPTGYSATNVNRGKNDGMSDIYAMTTVSLRYNFGRKKYSFQAPTLYAEAPATAPQTVTSTQLPVTTPAATTNTSTNSTNTTTNNNTYVEKTIVPTYTYTVPQAPQATPQMQSYRKDTLVNININYNYGYEGPVNTERAPAVTPATPAYDDAALKLEIERLRNELYKKQAEPSYIPKDDKIIIVPSTPAQSNNSQQLYDLQKQIADLNAQIATLKNQPAYVPPVTTPIVVNTATVSKESYQDEIRNIPPVSLYFATGSSTISQEEKEKLYQVISIYNKYPNIAKITLKGFTDAQGNPDANMALSQKRSNAVRDLLIQNYGINAADIVVNYFGQQNSTSTKSGNPYGRRVDVEFVK